MHFLWVLCIFSHSWTAIKWQLQGQAIEKRIQITLYWSLDFLHSCWLFRNFNTTLLDKHASKVRLFSKNYFENLEYWYHYFIFPKKSTVYLWGFKKSSRGWGRKEVKRVRASVQLSLKCTHIPKLIPQQAIYTHPYVYFCLSHFPFCVVFTLPHIISIFLFLSPDKIF